ncbi:aminotransferase class III-fold pyridoxal phosphate-dependent enzyme [Leucobacter sp. M11]|uniref:aminotransferase class III-fold pyridoxal phosphate-dependent enzyme n=1 Tax=Leucobacter sp. M11 TaxID=2993565 RepID=UPI002D80D751|nr:aminotransferase class III-fold pyridoxal phosphate-dependent enzyme [Leucobacter sp. M11]MEB4614759.1 aminotransferase class III-fold pyridoxal phosphate-dependent enzyme [Leucobacter sp. M11]
MPHSQLRENAQRHLFPHFTPGRVWNDERLPILVRGRGAFLYDERGDEYLDGLSGLFCVNIGHGRDDIAEAAVTQMRELAYWTNWGSAHPAAIEAASLIAELAPGDLETTFFVNSGSEAVESAVKFARQYHRSRGEGQRTKIIAREMAYHGTTLGALAVTGIPAYKAPFGPLMPGVFHVPNTLGEAVPEGGTAADLPSIRAIRELLEREGGDTFAALFAEPVQNSRGSLVPPPGYWQELRSICDEHGILLVADEVITGFGRLGEWFGSTAQGVVPDLLTFAKGSTSGYAPLGGVIIREPLARALWDSPEGGTFAHGATWGGHPVATAVAAANLRALRDEDVPGNVRALAPDYRAGLDAIRAEHPSIREVRGTGFFHTIEFTGNRDTGRELTPEESADILTRVIPEAMRGTRLITRPDNRGATMLVLAPPLVSDTAVLGRLLDSVDLVCGAVDARLG